MSLSYKLILAFLLVTLVAVGLAAAFLSFTTAVGFNQYIVDQRETQFVGVVKEHYRESGDWRGVETTLRQAGLLPPPAKSGDLPPDPQPFVLVDTSRRVIVSNGEYPQGEKVKEGTLARGVAVEVDGKVVGTVLNTGKAPPRNSIDQKFLSTMYRSLLIAALGGALVALILGIILARSLTRPVRDLTRATNLMAQGSLEQQVPVHAKDELGELAKSFNRMSADLSHANLARRQMTADIAHDLRNPLTVLGGYLESLQDGKLEPTPERLAIMRTEVHHLQHLVEDLRTLSVADAGDLRLQKHPFPPGELLERVQAAYRHQTGEAGIRLEVEVQPGLPETALDPERMEQVLGNLIGNSIRYTPVGGRILLSARHVAGELEFSVHDNGNGISPEILPHIFERSFRGDPSRSDDRSGLGLAIARSIVELHGGRISAESSPRCGSLFAIRIPDDHTDSQEQPLD